MSQLSKPKPTVARNQNSISDRMKNKPWEKPGSVLLWPTNQQWMIMIQASLQVRLDQNIQLHLKYSVVTFDINLSQMNLDWLASPKCRTERHDRTTSFTFLLLPVPQHITLYILFWTRTQQTQQRHQ